MKKVTEGQFMCPVYQMSECSDDDLKFAVRTGVNHIMPTKLLWWKGRTTGRQIKLVVFRERVESYGIMLANVTKERDINNIIK